MTPAGVENNDKVRRVELLISNVLRTGVIVSFGVIIVGMFLTMLHHPDATTSSPEFLRLMKAGSEIPVSYSDVLSGVVALQGKAVIMLGVWLLIATPVIRVAISIFAFIYQRDRTFITITAIVLILLVASFVLGKVEG